MFFADAETPELEAVCEELCMLYATWMNHGNEKGGWEAPDMDPLTLADFEPNQYGRRAIYRGLLEGSNGYVLTLTVNPFQDEGGPIDLTAFLDYDDGKRVVNLAGDWEMEQQQPPSYTIRLAYMDFDASLVRFYDLRVPDSYQSGMMADITQRVEQFKREANPFVYNDEESVKALAGKG